MVSSLLFVLSLILLLLLLGGMVKPDKIFLGNDSTRGKVAKIYGLGFVVSFLAFVVAVSESKTTEIATVAEPVNAASTSLMEQPEAK